jgi:uncharacterized membrane protein
MNSILTVLIVIVILALIVSGGFFTDACRRLGKSPQKDSTPQSKNSYNILIAASVVTWTVFAGLLGITIYYYVEHFRHKSNKQKAEILGRHYHKIASGNGLIITLGISSFVLMIMGILAADASENIKRANLTDDGGSYWTSLTGGVLALSISIVTIIIAIAAFWHKHTEATEAAIAEAKAEAKAKYKGGIIDNEKTTVKKRKNIDNDLPLSEQEMELLKMYRQKLLDRKKEDTMELF